LLEQHPVDAVQVVVQVRADLQLDVFVAGGNRLLAQPAELGIAETQSPSPRPIVKVKPL